MAFLAVCLAAGPAARAQVEIAQAEMASLETALSAAQIDTTFFVSLENLNDLAFDDDSSFDFDFIDDQGGPFVMRPTLGLFLSRRELATAALPWQGPYINFSSDRIQLGAEPYDRGSPLDPWGSPYFLFSPNGLMRGDSGAVTQELYGNAFDRYAIVSLGPDGVMSGDDVIRLFDGGVTETAVSRLSGDGVTTVNFKTGSGFFARAGAEITVEGFAFGAEQGASQVFFGETEVTEIVSWSSREIVVRLPDDVEGTRDFFLIVAGDDTNRLPLTIVPNAAQLWAEYE